MLLFELFHYFGCFGVKWVSGIFQKKRRFSLRGNNNRGGRVAFAPARVLAPKATSPAVPATSPSFHVFHANSSLTFRTAERYTAQQRYSSRRTITRLLLQTSRLFSLYYHCARRGKKSGELQQEKGLWVTRGFLRWYPLCSTGPN